MTTSAPTTLVITSPVVTRQYEGIARYDHDVALVRGSYPIKSELRYGQRLYWAHVDAVNIANGDAEGYSVRIECDSQYGWLHGLGDGNAHLEASPA